MSARSCATVRKRDLQRPAADDLPTDRFTLETKIGRDGTNSLGHAYDFAVDNYTPRHRAGPGCETRADTFGAKPLAGERNSRRGRIPRL